MLTLALPVLAEQTLAMLVGFSDTLLTGWYFQAEHLAAINLMVYILWLLNCLFVVVALGSTAMVARFFGAREFDQAARVVNQSFFIGAGIAAVATTLGLLFCDQAVALLQLEGESATLATRYLRIILPVIPLMMLEIVGIACLRGAGDMMAGLAIMALVNVFNIVVSWSLVLGLGPMPRLGWDGIAVGTAGGHALGGLLVIGLLLRGRSGLLIDLRRLRPDFDLIRRLLRIGVPGGADVMALITCHLWFVAIINQFGDVAAAAHGIAIRIESLAYLPGLAFQVAAATLTGQFLGARDYYRASRSVLMALLVGGGIMVTAGLVFFTAAEPLTRIFVRPDQPEVIALAASLLRLVAFAMPALAVTMILNGALRGAGDTRWPLFSSVSGAFGIRIPGAYLLTHYFTFGVWGAWYAMMADVTLRCLIVTSRFVHGGWKRVEV